MTISVKYDATAAKKVWGDYDPATLIEDMLAARTELLEDVDLFNSGLVPDFI